MSTLKPWVSAELEPSKKKQALADELRAFFREMWAEDEDEFQAMATSTDAEDSVNGTVTIDKDVIPYLIVKWAKHAHPESLTAAAKPSEVKRRIHWAQKDAGMDRRSIATRKAEFLAIQGSEPVAEQVEPNLDGRRDVAESDGVESDAAGDSAESE